MTHILTLQAIQPLNHNVQRLTFRRPDGYAFAPGQATDLAIEREGWRDEERPFTFTSLPDAADLEFTIKTYTDHNGVTKEIGRFAPGQQVRIGDPWGAIEDKGPGVFIAGGAGVTPFISILRAKLAGERTLEGSMLIFSNATEDDVFMRGEFEAMQGLETRFPITERDGEIDGDYLDREVGDFSGTFYLCGPPPMEEAITELLKARGVTGDRLVTEA